MSECEHPRVITLNDSEGERAGLPAGLWSCALCHEKFYPARSIAVATAAELKAKDERIAELENLNRSTINIVDAYEASMRSIREALGLSEFDDHELVIDEINLKNALLATQAERIAELDAWDARHREIWAKEAERAERLASRLGDLLRKLDPGQAPCDCCIKYGLYWHSRCDCQNNDDLGRAAAWCSHRNLFEGASVVEERRPDPVRKLVNEQAEDSGLWFEAQTAAEGYLQQALRRLHAAIEGVSPEECAARAVEGQQTNAQGADAMRGPNQESRPDRHPDSPEQSFAVEKRGLPAWRMVQEKAEHQPDGSWLDRWALVDVDGHEVDYEYRERVSEGRVP